jgi:hypothetical protein
MKASVENYKGIDFVRISSLPEDHQRMIWLSEYKNYVIKILRGKELINDCLSYADYGKWYEQHHPGELATAVPLVGRAKEPSLALK